VLDELASIDISKLDERIKGTNIIIASDVDNPLCGENGASFVYGPQKGASEEHAAMLDSNLAHYADVVNTTLGIDMVDVPCAGAAGGLGYGLMVFLGAKLKNGIGVVLDTIGFEKFADEADIVITGEGRIDAQTAHGKVPVGVAARCKGDTPVFAIAGSIDEGAEFVYDKGVDAFISAIVKPTSLEDAIGDSNVTIKKAGIRLFRTIHALRPDL
jgi:glycerate kinase